MACPMTHCSEQEPGDDSSGETENHFVTVPGYPMQISVHLHDANIGCDPQWQGNGREYGCKKVKGTKTHRQNGMSGEFEELVIPHLHHDSNLTSVQKIMFESGLLAECDNEDLYVAD